MFDQLVQTTASAFNVMFGVDIPIKLSGIVVKTVKGFAQYEIVESGENLETGSSILTLIIDRSDYYSLGKGKRHTFFVENFDQVQSGPPLEDGSGFVKLHLTRA